MPHTRKELAVRLCTTPCAIERHGATEWRRSQRGLIHISYAENHINLSPLRMNHQQLSYFALAEPNS